MKILSGVYVYNRPQILRHCLNSLLNQTLQPDELILIDDGSAEGARSVVDLAMKLGRANISLHRKGRNRGATHSGRVLYAQAAFEKPEYLFTVEADYIFKPHAFQTAVDVFEKTEAGKYALGICGYDHPNAYSEYVRNVVFPRGIALQMGEDNVNRAALYRPFTENGFTLELASNTCPTSYLAWAKIQRIAQEFNDLHRCLMEINDPQENPNYPESGEYRLKNYVDDGMLSHCISYFWNKWAIKHGIDRDRFGAWLNIKPSIANNITGGGEHTALPELATDGGSPSWTQ